MVLMYFLFMMAWTKAKYEEDTDFLSYFFLCVYFCFNCRYMLVQCSKFWKRLTRVDMLQTVILEIIATTPEASRATRQTHQDRFDASTVHTLFAVLCMHMDCSVSTGEIRALKEANIFICFILLISLWSLHNAKRSPCGPADEDVSHGPAFGNATSVCISFKSDSPTPVPHTRRS